MEVLPNLTVADYPLTEVPAPAKVAPPAPGTKRLRPVLGIVTLAWMFGSIWSMTTTSEPLTLFAQKLGASNFQFGLLTALPFLASLMSLAGSVLIEWTGKRKEIFLPHYYAQRAMWFVIALAPLWVLSRFGRAELALDVFLCLMLIMYALGAVGGPAWTCWMADLVPVRINGAYFSRRRQWGNLTAIPAAIFVGWFLDRFVPPDGLSVLRWCAILFLCAAVCGLTDIHLFQYVPPVNRSQSRNRLLGSLKKPLHDAQFIRFSTYVACLTFSVTLLGQFATLYLLDQAGASNLGVQVVLVVAPMLAQLLLLGYWGRAADRIGKKPLLILSSIGLVPVALAWSFVGPGRLWLGFILSGAGAGLWAGVEVANLNLVLESTGGSRGGRAGGSGYAAINTVIINLAGCFGGLAAGLLAQLLRNWHWQPVVQIRALNFYDVLFIASAVLRLGAVLLLLPLVQENRHPHTEK